MKIKIKTINSPRSYMFHQGQLAKTVRVADLHARKDYQQDYSKIANVKFKKLPISINQFKKQKQPYEQIPTLQLNNTQRQKSHILNKRIHNHQITQLLKNTQSSFDSKDTCRSQRKRGRFFINLSTKNVFRNKMSKDKQITSVRNEDHSFGQKQLHQTLSLHRNKSQLKTKQTKIKETLYKQSNKYEVIRSTMKKLKNLSEIKLLQQKKSRRLETTTQQWDCIESIIEKINFPMNNNLCNDQSQEKDASIGKPIILIDNLQQQQQDEQCFQQQTSVCKELSDSLKKIQQAQTDFSEDNQQKQVNDLLENQEIPSIQHKKQFSIVCSLFLIFQRIFNKVDFIIPKVQDLCLKYQIQSGKSVCHFLKMLYLNRKLVETILLHEKNTTDFIVNLTQIKQENQILFEILNGTCTKYNKSLSKKAKLSIINALQTTDNIESLKLLIEQQKPEYLSSNIKTVRKILKKISKDQKTIEKQFQVFLNYSACFINLHKSYQVILNVIQNQPIIIDSSNIPEQDQKQTHEQQFLYNECNLIKQKYLEFDESQFERHFSDQKGHQQIENYYHRLIKQVRNVDATLREVQAKN